MPKTKRTRNPRLTREALLRAGSELFAARGFDGATVELIARKARINKAMIHYYFGGKEGLYKAILAATFIPAIEQLRGLRRAGRPAGELLGEFIAIFGEINEQNPLFSTMVLREILSGGKHFDEETKGYFLNIYSHLREIIEGGVRDGTFRPVHPLLTHLGLIGSLVHFFAIAPFRDRLIAEGRIPSPVPGPGAYIRHLQALMSRGLAADSRRGARKRSRREE